MKVLFDRRFLKDIETIKDKRIKRQVEIILSAIESVETLTDIPNLKKLKGHKSAYRIKAGNYRLGFFFQNNTIIFTRLLLRKDVYKYFP